MHIRVCMCAEDSDVPALVEVTTSYKDHPPKVNAAMTPRPLQPLPPRCCLC